MIEWLIYFSLDPIFRKQIVEPLDWRSAFENSKPFRSDQLDLRQQKTEPALNTYVLNMFLKKNLCFEHTSVWELLCFENTNFWKIWTPQKKSPSVLIHLKFSLRSRVPKPTFRRSVTSKSPIVVPADLGVPETKDKTEEDMF